MNMAWIIVLYEEEQILLQIASSTLFVNKIWYYVAVNF